MDFFLHDSRSEFYRSPTGAVPCASGVCLRVRANGLSNVTLRFWWKETEYRMFMRKMDNDVYE